MGRLLALFFAGMQRSFFGLEIGNGFCDQCQRQLVVRLRVQTLEVSDFNIDRFAPFTHALTLRGNN